MLVKKILVFSFFPAFVPCTSGGETRLFNFYRSLSRYHDVVLLSSGHRGVGEERIIHGANFLERRIAKDDGFAQAWMQLQPYAGEADMSGPCLAQAASTVSLLHKAYLEEYAGADVIIHDSPFTVDYDLFAGVDGKVRIYNAYNCETELYRALHPDARSAPVHARVEKAERRLLQVADCVLYCNEADLAGFADVAPGASFDTLFVPNGVLAQATPPHRRAGGAPDAFRAVFMGSAHAPNVEAALFVAQTLAPSLPDIVFDILGSCLPEGRYPDNVVRHGLVSTQRKAELLAGADIALNPMMSGSGSNVKVFDYFSYGLPVLSTPTGMRGVEAVDGEHCLLAPVEQFAKLLGRWREQYAQWQHIGSAGQKLVGERYTWDNITHPVTAYCEQACERVANEAPRAVLVLNDYNSFTSIGGGATRTRGLYAAVAQWEPVVFICFSGSDALGIETFEPGITVISIPRTPEHQAELMRQNALSPVAVDDVVAGQQATRNTLLLAVYLAIKPHARVIVAEHPYMAGVPALYGDRFVYSSQNSETLLKARLFEPYEVLRPLIPVVRQMEQRAVEQAAAVIAVSEEDAASLSIGVRTAGPLVVVRNGAEAPAVPEHEVLQEIQRQIWPRSAVFLGSAHPPNAEAARFIIQRLAALCPDVQFHLIGSVCSSVGESSRGNVRLWGVLDEQRKAAVMQSCTLALNPMSSGSGSNVKLADFFANGLFTITTEFGQRGYPAAIQPHVVVTELEGFAPALRTALERLERQGEQGRHERRRLFDESLSMRALGEEYSRFLQALELPRKRVLFVTYRYTAPALGGAEVMCEQLLRSLDSSGCFEVDVVATAVSSMSNVGRFAETYGFEAATRAFVGLQHTRFARFEVDAPPANSDGRLARAWRLQCAFERSVYAAVAAQCTQSALAWGWSPGEDGGGQVSPWAFSSAGLHLGSAGEVCIEGEAPVPVALLVQDANGQQLYNEQVSGRFSIRFDAPAGMVELFSSAAEMTGDPRPLAFLARAITLGGEALDLSLSPICQTAGKRAAGGFDILDEAARLTRNAAHLRLTDLRGPWSAALESFLEANVGKYDLVVTHNSVFRPAIAAIEHARRCSVPSILIPHAHLDDDYYHFPDVTGCALEASLVMAAPRAACKFFERKGCHVEYLPAGIDPDETFTHADRQAFKELYPSDEPFVLVLGRKAGAKGYQKIIDAVGRLQAEAKLNVVLIGPDDDGLPVKAPYASYLGRQPREVVRGALLSCVALVNMSDSESFGIVLLEAWMAGKPVVANEQCAAFQDMAVDGVNALLVDGLGLKPALLRLLQEPGLGAQLAAEGAKQLQLYHWSEVGRQFTAACKALVSQA